MNPTPPFTPTDADLERLDNAAKGPIVALNEDVTTYRPPDPMAMVAAAIERGMDPQKILDFIDRVNATKAAEKFATSLAKFQAECPQILKTRLVRQSESKGGREMYKFASYDDIHKAVAPLLVECGIVVTFDISPEVSQNGVINGACRIRVGSHSECTRMPIAILKGMNTTAAQDFGGTLTYLKRYLFCAALNIIVTDKLEEDRDGVTPGDFLNSMQIAALEAGLKAIREAGNPIKNLVSWLDWLQPGTKTLEDVTQGNFKKASDDLARRLNQKGGAK